MRRARRPTFLRALGTLFGRAADVAAVKALLAQHAVVTVAGAGGIGKTRVAQTVAAQLAEERIAEFPDGVWWVELAPLADGALVPSAVARVLDTLLRADRPPVETLAAVLASQRLLLVLDNCEHVTEAVASLVDTLCAAAPGLRVLVTSQETLKTSDEHVYRLGALAVPAVDASVDALHAGAVELFVARAQAVDPRFTLTPENVHAVVEICRRLDGIPLAIELAAARVPLLGVEGLRTRLDERFNVLTAGARVVLRRHQTLRATLEWSHGAADARRADRVSPARRLRRQLHARVRAARRAGRADRPVGRARSPGRAGGQVAGARRRRSRAALPAARNRACLRARAAGRRTGKRRR